MNLVTGTKKISLPLPEGNQYDNYPTSVLLSQCNDQVSNITSGY